MELTYHGHASFTLKTAGGTALIDPWFTGNPLADRLWSEAEADWIFLTHAHFDHMGDALAIARARGAVIVAVSELAKYCAAQGGVETLKVNVGGSIRLPLGTVRFPQAFHSSSIDLPDGRNLYGGEAVGLLFQSEGKCIYHAGDTGLFGDMALLGRRYPLDVALLPIGGTIVMDPDDAAYASDLLGAKLVIPMHYNSFPSICQDPYVFKTMLAERGQACRVMEPGQTLIL